MSLVFAILLGEMAFLLVLVLPLPFPVRTKINDATSAVTRTSNFKIGLFFVTFVLGLQFADCLQRLNRHGSSSPYFTSFSQAANSNLLYDQLASKFYAQRNLYISGAVLYLEVSIYTVITIIRKMVKKEAEYRSVTNIHQKNFKNTDDEAEEYRNLIKQKELDIATLRKQLNGSQKQYDSLNESIEKKKDD